ncbi:hypothetical protein FIBSPDRAFT_969925, partial [Athelia psychrophila]
MQATPAQKFPSVTAILSAPSYLDMYHNRGAVLGHANRNITIRECSVGGFTWSLPFVGSNSGSALFSAFPGRVTPHLTLLVMEMLLAVLSGHNRHGSRAVAQRDRGAEAADQEQDSGGREDVQVFQLLPKCDGAAVRPSPGPSGRTRHVEAILGPELFARLPQTKVLLVGAGGIGCELLKNIVLTGLGHITILDLDTIDLSNLNRQFLFKKKDVKQSKALIAAQTTAPFNPNVRLHPIHGNIKEPQFDIEWFEGFDIVLNALDNLEARRHVNKMCMAAKVPLVESGTAGYLGQVQPLLKDRTECFDCIPKPTPKTFPTCTIRSTPLQPIHCIVWAKSYSLGQLFGEDEDAEGELDDAEKQGENVQEIATLHKEAQAFKAVRTALRTTAATGDAARMVFQK